MDESLKEEAHRFLPLAKALQLATKLSYFLRNIFLSYRQAMRHVNA
jgi:hypothetical protein